MLAHRDTDITHLFLIQTTGLKAVDQVLKGEEVFSQSFCFFSVVAAVDDDY
jgi:hypothetical protein